MINVGITGLGFMGMIHYLAYQKVRDAAVKAICEIDPERLAGDWRSIKGNFGPQGKKMNLEGISQYPQLDELLADPTIDLVDICLPPAAHCDAVCAALEAGKHVFCEKPIALEVADAKKMVKTAEQSGKMLMIGHVLPFFPEYRYAYRTITDGQYGKLIGGYFRRMIADPTWLPHFYDPAVCGGPMLDLHIHDAHFIRAIAGMPASVTTVGRMRGEVLELFSSQFTFDDPNLFITASSGTLQQQGRPFTHAYEIYLEKATILFDFAAIGKESHLLPVTLMTENGRIMHPKLGAGDPVDSFVEELKEVVKSVRTGEPSALLHGELARDALVMAHKETQSAKTGRTVKVA